MTMKTVTAIAVALGVFAMANVAEAGGKRHHKHGGHSIGFHFDHGGFYDRRYRPNRVCKRLKRKAYYTGSRYWWKRYRRCMDRHYY